MRHAQLTPGKKAVVVQVFAAVEDRKSGTRMVVFDVHIGENQASWERQRVIPESLDDACTLTSPSSAEGQQSRSAEAAFAWQVWPQSS